MSTAIKFSRKYLDTIKCLLKVFNDLPDKRHGLFFKNNGNVYISAMSKNTLVHVATTENNVSFQDNEIGITSLPEFLNYVTAINYLDDPDAEIINAQETSTKSNKIFSFMFKGKRSTYRMPVAHPKWFTEAKDRIVPKAASDDRLKLVAKFYITSEDNKLLVKDVQLMNKIENFNLSIVDNKIKIYMKGIQNQQFSRIFEGSDIQIYDNFTTVTSQGENILRIFPTRIFDYMSYFGCDFEVELRTIPTSGIMAIKCRGVVEKDNSTPDDIHVFVGTQENSAEVYTNKLDIVE